MQALVRPYLENANSVWHPTPTWRKILRHWKVSNVVAQSSSHHSKIYLMKTVSRLWSYQHFFIKKAMWWYNWGLGPSIQTLNKELFKQRENSKIRKKIICHTSGLNLEWSIRISSSDYIVVAAPSLHSFERRLDKHWGSQPLYYDFKSELEKTGSHLCN